MAQDLATDDEQIELATYDDLPSNVQALTTRDAVQTSSSGVNKRQCVACGIDLFTSDVFDSHYMVDEMGCTGYEGTRHDEIESGGMELYLLAGQRQGVICGGCQYSLIDRSPTLRGLFPRNQSYDGDVALLSEGTGKNVVVQYPYWMGYDDPDGTAFEETFIAYLTGVGEYEGLLPIGEWFDSKERYYGNNYMEGVDLPQRYNETGKRRSFFRDIEQREIEFDFPIFMTNNSMYVPEQHVSEIEEVYKNR